MWPKGFSSLGVVLSLGSLGMRHVSIRHPDSRRKLGRGINAAHRRTCTCWPVEDEDPHYGFKALLERVAPMLAELGSSPGADPLNYAK
jgi:hypothetical protein